MNKIHRRRAYWIIASIISIFLTVALVLYALRSNINLFYTPSQVLENIAPQGSVIRVGGLVVKDSIKRQDLEVQFAITDIKSTMIVRYRGILPDLFREGQGVVVMGSANAQHEFIATQVLARHDENYMPPEVSDAVKKQFQKVVKENLENNVS